MLIDPLKLFSPSCFRIPEAQQGDLVVTDEGEPEATDDGPWCDLSRPLMNHSHTNFCDIARNTSCF
ncbi:hypothetical protein HBN74_01750 [Pseudomonas sp. WS 5019]|nr:hypothetical protein [Pseudomonas sp. WS 5019]NMY14283.1 hypothetical protein [Pseudomonas sp. WS 5019]